MTGIPRAAGPVVYVADLRAPELDATDGHHLRQVLRHRVGDPVAAGDGRGAWRPCRLGRTAVLEPDDEIRRVPPPAPPITIGVSLIKGERPELAVAKLTEVGVDRIIVVAAARSVVRWEGERAGRQLDRLRGVARAAARQCRRLWLPEVSGPVEPAALAAPGVAIADFDGGPPSLGHPVVLVGPEGGWTDGERGRFDTRVTLGPTVLRTETAAIAAGVLLCGLRSGVVDPRTGSRRHHEP